MNFQLLCVGKVKKYGIRTLCETFLTRLSAHHKVSIEEIPDRTGARSAEQAIAQESADLLKRLERAETVIVLDERGKQKSSEKFAKWLDGRALSGQSRITLVIGGAYGLSEDVRKRANLLLRLSEMTLPHELVRVVLLEQLYRADCILRNHPYHHGDA
jgi:23S rRNA (pseudouridine1915-N3)-methyltransferase